MAKPDGEAAICAPETGGPPRVLVTNPETVPKPGDGPDPVEASVPAAPAPPHTAAAGGWTPVAPPPHPDAATIVTTAKTAARQCKTTLMRLLTVAGTHSKRDSVSSAGDALVNAQRTNIENDCARVES